MNGVSGESVSSNNRLDSEHERAARKTRRALHGVPVLGKDSIMTEMGLELRMDTT